MVRAIVIIGALWELLVLGFQDIADFWLVDHPIAFMLILGSVVSWITYLVVA